MSISPMKAKQILSFDKKYLRVITWLRRETANDPSVKGRSPHLEHEAQKIFPRCTLL